MVEFSKGELLEVSDALVKALKDLLDAGDPERYEALYGSASNLLSAMRKVVVANLGSEPSWIAEYEQRVSALRAAQTGDPKAAEKVRRFLRTESALGMAPDEAAAKDGIR